MDIFMGVYMCKCTPMYFGRIRNILVRFCVIITIFSIDQAGDVSKLVAGLCGVNERKSKKKDPLAGKIRDCYRVMSNNMSVDRSRVYVLILSCSMLLVRFV